MATRLLASLTLFVLSAASFGFSSAELWQNWPEERFVPTSAPCLRHAELTERLDDLVSRYPEEVTLEKVGESVLGRSIQLMTLGRGPRKIFLWSQMHGDEPSATPALLDIAHYLLGHANEPGPKAIVDELTLLMIPMLNPDGTEVYRRRNAQGIDINRDALNLTTPEGRILKTVRDKHEPMLGFNLHDQNRRTAVGDTGFLATNAVLAVAGDPEGTVTPGRMRAKRACSAIVETLAPFIPDGMARYDEDWSPRAFGDNITAWGTPVVLIESGGLPPGQDFSQLTRLNFVAILTVLRDLAKDDLAGYDPEVYEQLLRNKSNSWSEVSIRNNHVLQPGSSVPYRADFAFLIFRDDRQHAGCAADDSAGSMIFEIGDNRFFGSGREVEGRNSVLMAPFVVGVKGWVARKWLDEKVLADLAPLGVGTVRWSVSKKKASAANELAGEMNQKGRAELVVIPPTASLPSVLLIGPPPAPPLDSLAAVLGTPGAEELQDLWPDAMSATRELPAIRRGQPASFLLVFPAPEGRIDLAHTALNAVWLDGFEIHNTP